jgi:DNA-binding MarR family transcriptional regulator
MPDKKADLPAWDPLSSAGFWINHTSRRMLRLHETRLRSLGLSMGQMPVLIALEERGALPQKELAAIARVEQPTMAEMLVRMERDGFVQRAPNPDDKRGSLISLTRTARARLLRAKTALSHNESTATTGLTKTDKAVLIELLRRVAQNLEDETTSSAATPSSRRRPP